MKPITYTTREAARLLGLGRNELVKKMREWGMLHGDNVPVKKHIDAGRLIAKTGTYWHNGIMGYRYSSTASITVDGMQYIQSMLEKENQHHSLNQEDHQRHTVAIRR